ncbi:MAG: sigma-70 family RNA polymerase sigma factor [Caldilineaceae bacterium]
MDCTAFVEMPLNRPHVQEKTSEPRQAAPVQSPHSLIVRAQAGELQAFNQLIGDKQALAYNMAFRILRSQEAAADAVQESLIKAYRALASYRGGSFQGWFVRILINTCYDLLRVQKRHAAASLDDLPTEIEDATQLADPIERPEAYAERMEVRHWLEQGITSLPADQRIALVLSDVEGYSYQEISEMTDAPIGTVKSRISRGRSALRDYLLRHKVL